MPLLVASAAAQIASSTFDTGNDGWTVHRTPFGIFNVTSSVTPARPSSGGNPGGFIQTGDGPFDYYFSAPAKFLGNKAAAYGGRLEFDLISNLLDDPVPPPRSLFLIGGGVTNYARFTAISSPGTWIRFVIELHEGGDWINDATQLPSTPADLITALSSLAVLDINGEFAGGVDTGGIDNVNMFTNSLLPSVVVGPVTNVANAHVYYLLTASTWGVAEQAAVSLGGHLATINDAAEQDWVLGVFGATNRALWIGLSDRDVQGSHRWVSGDPSSYRNWRSEGPRSLFGFERCVAMQPNGRWTDATPHTTGISGVVEVLPGPASRVDILPAFEVRWTTQTTNRYQLQWSSIADSNNWFSLGSEIQGSGSTQSFFDSSTDAAKKFYRVMTLP